MISPCKLRDKKYHVSWTLQRRLSSEKSQKQTWKYDYIPKHIILISHQHYLLQALVLLLSPYLLAIWWTRTFNLSQYSLLLLGHSASRNSENSSLGQSIIWTLERHWGTSHQSMWTEAYKLHVLLDASKMAFEFRKREPNLNLWLHSKQLNTYIVQTKYIAGSRSVTDPVSASSMMYMTLMRSLRMDTSFTVLGLRRFV